MRLPTKVSQLLNQSNHQMSLLVLTLHIDLPKSLSVQPITMFSSSASLEELVTKLGGLVHRRGELTSIREEMSQIYLEFRSMLTTTEQGITDNRQYQEGLREQWNSALDNLRYNEESVPSDFQERRSAVLSRARDEGRRMQYERTTVNADIAAAREKLRAMDAKIGVLDARIQELRNEIERIGHGSR